MSQYEAVIGLEVHAQLATESKIFCQAPALSGREPNTLTDPLTLGLPGSLPVLNKRVIDFALRLGLATNCTINRENVFARKHYFYPDMPKGYQISQYTQPICSSGKLEINCGESTKVIHISRIHMEEDAGKLVHRDDEPTSIVDLNRAGVPLLEIVSAPNMASAEEAGAYLRLLRQILRYLEICDGNMEEGSMRCDANISVRLRGSTALGTKVEIKNLNSFRFVEPALEYEIPRQVMLVEGGEKIQQETRLWDEQKGVTKLMRSKEEADDYRYFPDPDIPPLFIDQGWIEKTRSAMPELPQQVYQRFRQLYGLEPYYCELLSAERLVARYFDQAVSFHYNPTTIANWIGTEVFGRLNKEGMAFEDCPVSPENLAQLIKLIDEGTISGKIAKGVFDEMFNTGHDAEAIVKAQDLVQISDSAALDAIINAVLQENPLQVAQYHSGKEKMFGFFVGQVMKRSEGKANPVLTKELLEKRLKSG